MTLPTKAHAQNLFLSPSFVCISFYLQPSKIIFTKQNMKLLKLLVLVTFFHKTSTEKEEMILCSSISRMLEQENKEIASNLPPDIAGKWVSQSCEVRPGPEYILRKYQFTKQSSDYIFLLEQFYYGDSACSVPLHVITARGKLHFTKESWLVVGGQDADYSLFEVTVYPYSSETTVILSSAINNTCPGWVTSQWRSQRSYVILSSRKGDNERDCLQAFYLTFNELQLIRVESRPVYHSGKIKSELLLGDIHTQLHLRTQYRPTSYQQPLVKTSGIIDCPICKTVAQSSETSPPHIQKIFLHLYPSLSGDWFSYRCETESLGTFLHRRVNFHDLSWQAAYVFYSDPLCIVPTLRIVAKGEYQVKNSSTIVSGAWNVDFQVTSAVLTPLDVGIVNHLNGHENNSCGITGQWLLGQSKEITSTFGCAGLGIVVPSMRFQILYIDTTKEGAKLLYLGVTDTDYRQYTENERPTAYQTPLIHCKDAYENLEDNNIGPIPNALFSNGCQMKFNFDLIVFFLYICRIVAT